MHTLHGLKQLKPKHFIFETLRAANSSFWNLSHFCCKSIPNTFILDFTGFINKSFKEKAIPP